MLQDERNKHGGDMLLNGRAPRPGEMMKLPLLANTFKVSRFPDTCPQSMCFSTCRILTVQQHVQSTSCC